MSRCNIRVCIQLTAPGIPQEGGCKITFRMQAGDPALRDNQRVLHGREVQAFGERRLQGAQADRDNLLRVIRVLERELHDG